MKKITLNRETVRKLNGDDLKRAYGGNTVPGCCDTNITACNSPETCIDSEVVCLTQTCNTCDTCETLFTCNTCNGPTCRGPRC